MIKLFFISISLFLLSSCYNVNRDEPVEPDILLSKEQMVEILTEVQLTEAGFQFKYYRNKAKELKPEFYNKILKQYGITLQQFKDNIDYYNYFPKVMEEIYESVLANLSKIQSEVLIEEQEAEKIRIADSIAIITDSLNSIRADSLVLEKKL